MLRLGLESLVSTSAGAGIGDGDTEVTSQAIGWVWLAVVGFWGLLAGINEPPKNFNSHFIE